ncbi:MAG: hypothetical protein ACOVN7_10710 [Rubrivivax sp.]
MHLVHGPEWAVDYLDAAACDWRLKETEYVDWVFNTSLVLKERAGRETAFQRALALPQSIESQL